ncbi:MAG: hypothetical protein ACI9OI_000360, partial [Chitinophagales bacterium]
TVETLLIYFAFSIINRVIASKVAALASDRPPIFSISSRLVFD